VEAIANRGTINEGRIRQSPWWKSVESVLTEADDDELEAVRSVIDPMDDLTFRFGAWHGDFTPWNIMSTRNVGQVIDWEFAADGVPVGFDVCHYHTQVASELRGLPTPDAIAHSARMSPHDLDRLGLDPDTQSNIWYLYLVELVRRTLALRAAGMPTDDVGQGAAAVDRLLRRPSASAVRSLPSNVSRGA